MKTGDIFTGFEWRMRLTATNGNNWLRNRLLSRGSPTARRHAAANDHRTSLSPRPAPGCSWSSRGLKCSPDAILAFANRYGQLGFPVTMRIAPGGGIRERTRKWFSTCGVRLRRTARGMLASLSSLSTENGTGRHGVIKVISMAAALNIAEAGALGTADDPGRVPLLTKPLAGIFRGQRPSASSRCELGRCR